MMTTESTNRRQGLRQLTPEERLAYDQPIQSARRLAEEAGSMAKGIIRNLNGQPYESLARFGLLADISPYIVIPEVQPEHIGTMFARVFVAYNPELAPNTLRRGWQRLTRTEPATLVEGSLSRVGVHYYRVPDKTGYRATVNWDGATHGSVADAFLTLGVLQALVDLREVASPADEPPTPELV